jgi:iron complex outermembrane recepter protein
MRNATLAAAIAMALQLPAAIAQEAPAQTATLGDVIVTAQRRSENIQDVPVAVSTVSEGALDAIRSGGDDIRFLSARLPSLNIESSFGRAFPRFYIRGLGNTDFDLNASQPVSLVYDDVVQESPILKGFPVFDLEMVEMFRGPQGTLFGRNTPAGVVKFNSVRPSSERGGYVQAAYGTHSSMNVEGAVGGALSDQWSMRLSGIYQHRDDWVDNRLTLEGDKYEGFDEVAGRLQFLYGSGPLEALVNVHARSLDGSARMFRANILTPGSNDLQAGFDENEVALDGANDQSLDSVGGSLRIAYEYGRVTLHSITGYESVEVLSHGDIDGGFGADFIGFSGPCSVPARATCVPFPAESADGLPDHSQFTQEFRWESRDWGRFDWQAGVYYFDESLTIDSFNYDTLSSGVRNGDVEQRQDNKAWAVFGSGELEVSDAFTLRAGVRYTQDDKEFSAERFLSPIGAGPIGPIEVDTDEDNVSWDVSGTWAIADSTNLYARIAQGFRAPSIQGRLLFGDTVSVADSEEILSFEAGIKTSLFNDRGRLALSVYKYTMDDQQLTAVGGGANFNTLLNADQTDGQGVELDFEAYLADNFLVTLGASWNDTEIDDPDLAIQPCGGGCTVLDPAGPLPGTVSIDGNRLPQSPEVIGNFTARWGMPVAAGEFYVYTDWSYRSEVNFFLYESAEFEGKELLEGGLRLGYLWDDGRHEVALYGRNITDEIEAVGGIDFNNLTGFINEPRRWFVEFRSKF